MRWLILIIVVIILLIYLHRRNSCYVSPVPGKTVWLLWLQGWDSVPRLVQLVKESWIKHNPGWNIELVDAKNLKNYVDIPYIDKIKSPAAKSDAIRLHLLATHGGVWADATLLCMMPLDEWVYDALEPIGFWMYHGRDQGRGPCSWFIVSTVNSPLIRKWRDACDEYWSSRSVEHYYFWMDELFTNLLNSDDEFKKEWEGVPYLWCESPGQSHMLAGHLEEDDPERKRFIKDNPPYVIKLSRGVDENFEEKLRDSNVTFAIKASLGDDRTSHVAHSLEYKNEPKLSDDVVVVADCGNMKDINSIKDAGSAELIVYDKCNFCKTAPEDVRCRPRRNVGREQETYLHFVIKHYSNLPKNIVFIPTPVEKHDRLNRYKEILKTGKNQINDGATLEEHKDFTLPEYEGRKVAPASVRPFKAWYETFIGPWNPDEKYVYNGIYKSTRDSILKTPLIIFKNIWDQVQTADDAEVTHFLERSMVSLY